MIEPAHIAIGLSMLTTVLVIIQIFIGRGDKSGGEYKQLAQQMSELKNEVTTKFGDVNLQLANLRTELARNLVMLFSAQVSALEPKVRLAITDANLKLEAAKANLQALEMSVDAKVKAALSGADMVARMASAGINAINAQTSIQGNDSSSV